MVIINYLLVCLIFGTTFLAIKVGIEAGAPPFLSAGIRFFAAGAIMILVFKIRKHRIKSLLFSKSLMFNGFCLTFMTFATLYWAEQYIPSGLAAVLSATGPMMVLFLQARQQKTGFKIEQLLGLITALLGVILISSPGFSASISIIWVFACFLIIFGGWFYSLGTIRAKDFTNKNPNISPFLTNAIQMLYGGLFLLILSLMTEQLWSKDFHFNGEVLFSLIYLIIVGSIGGHGLYYWLVSKTNPVFPSTWLYVSPLVAILVGYIWLDEVVTPIMMIGALLILFGVFLTNRAILMEHWKKGRLFKRIA